MNTFSLDGLPDKDDAANALDLVREIQSLAEELPERAEDFGIQVLETTTDIGIYIEKHEHVTKRQLVALENMLEGIQRWFHD